MNCYTYLVLLDVDEKLGFLTRFSRHFTASKTIAQACSSVIGALNEPIMTSKFKQASLLNFRQGEIESNVLCCAWHKLELRATAVANRSAMININFLKSINLMISNHCLIVSLISYFVLTK